MTTKPTLNPGRPTLHAPKGNVGCPCPACNPLPTGGPLVSTPPPDSSPKMLRLYSDASNAIWVRRYRESHDAFGLKLEQLTAAGHLWHGRLGLSIVPKLTATRRGLSSQYVPPGEALGVHWSDASHFLKSRLGSTRAGSWRTLSEFRAQQRKVRLAFEAPGGDYNRTEYFDGVVHSWTPRRWDGPRGAVPPTPPPFKISQGLSAKQASRIGRACDWIAFSSPGGRKVPFVTLTFREQRICHVWAKRCLDVFFKAAKRKFPGLFYVWVAELQKRGTIHFHICTNAAWIDSSWVQDTWRRITGDNTLLTHVMGVKNPGGYMAKYLAKGQGDVSQPIWGRRCCVSFGLARAIRARGNTREPMDFLTYKESKLNAGRGSKNRIYTGKMTFKTLPV